MRSWRRMPLTPSMFSSEPMWMSSAIFLRFSSLRFMGEGTPLEGGLRKGVGRVDVAFGSRKIGCGWE